MTLVLGFVPACLTAPDVWPCETQADCEEGEACTQGLCRPRGFCQSDFDCKAGYACVSTQCTLAPKPQCSPGPDPRCAPYLCGAGSVCLGECVGAGDCATGFNCVGGVCVAEQCNASNAFIACHGYVCAGSTCRTTCAASDDCTGGYQCLSVSCVPPPSSLGETCATAEDCATGICCEDALFGMICTAACRERRPGATCAYSAECLSGACTGGTCADCMTGECANIVCADVECGPVVGADCGGCGGAVYCHNNACVEPCTGLECGTDHDVDCGTCDDASYCDSNQCVEACIGLECGTDHNVDCGTCTGGRICSSGACEKPTCTIGNYSCIGDEIVRCSLDGVAVTSVTTCDVLHYCQDGSAECASYSCAAAEGFCDQDVFHACDGAGQRIPNSSQDCAEDDLRCTPLGCLALHVDMVAAPQAEVADQGACGNVYFIETDVTLEGVMQQMTGPPSIQLGWFVYRGDSAAGPYERVASFDGVFRSEAGEYSSPPLQLSLGSGGYYFIGVGSGSGYVFELDTSAAEPQDTSFGQMVQGACSLYGLPDTLPQVTDFGVAPQSLTTY